MTDSKYVRDPPGGRFLGPCSPTLPTPSPPCPERVFSVLNDTFEDDMDRSYADYIELSLQLQFNERTRE